MISVIMGAYHEPKQIIRKSIESILNQTYADFEFIIVLDDPSNISLLNILNKYSDKDSRVRIIVNDKNLGLAASLNKAVNSARGYYIARMDADDIALPERLKVQYDYLIENDLDLIGGLTEMIDEEGKSIYSVGTVPEKHEQIIKSLKYGAVLAHPTWFGRAKVFKELNGYRLVPRTEDYDFCVRAALHRFRLGNIQRVVLKYRMTSDSISRSNLFEQYLYMRYLSNQYSNGQIADLEQAKEYVSREFTEKKGSHYARANAVFTTMLQQMSARQIVGFVGNGFKLLVASPYFLDKIRRFALLKLNSR